MFSKKSKITGVLLSALMVIQFACTNVLAYTGTTPYSYNFSSVVKNTNNAAEGIAFNNHYNLGIHNFAPVKGIADKRNDDTSLRMYTVAGTYPAGYTGQAGDPYQDLRGPYVQKTIGIKELAGTDIFHISFDMLNENNAVPKIMYLKAFLGADTSSTSTANLITMGSGLNRTISFAGTAATLNYQIGKWYTFDIFIYGASRNAAYYVNGTLVDAAAVIPTTGDKNIMGIDLARFSYTIGDATNKTVAETGLALDNLSYEMLTALPTLTPKADYKPVASSDFSSYRNNTKHENIMDNAISYSNMNVDAGNFSPVLGKYGKLAEDTSLYIHNDEKYFPSGTTDPNGGSNRYLNNPYLSMKMTNKDYVLGDVAHLGIEIALENYTTGKSVQMYVFKDTSTSSLSVGNVIEFTTDKRIKVLGDFISVTSELNKWYKVDAYITAGSPNKLEVYLDGKKVKEKTFSADNVAGGNLAMTGVAEFRIGYGAAMVNTTGTNGDPIPDPNNAAKSLFKFKADGIYYDDIMFNVYRPTETLPNVTSTLSHTDAAINRIIKTNYLSPVPADYTVESFLAGASAANSVDLYVIDATGAKVTTGFLLGKTIVIVPVYGGAIYYGTRASDTVLSHDFNYTITPNVNPSSIFGYSKFYNATNGQYPWHTSYGQTGVGGKAANDTAFFMKTQNFDNIKPTPDPYGTNAISDPFIDYTATTEVNENVTYEVNLLAMENTHDNVFSIAINGTSYEYLKDIINLKGNGDISLNGTVVGKWISGRWYKFAVTLYYGTNKADIYMNGVPVCEKTVVGNLLDANKKPTTSMTSFKRFKSNVSYGTPPAGQTYSGLMGIDNLKFYTGAYTPDAISMSMLGDYAKVDYTNKKINITQPIDYTEFVNSIVKNANVGLKIYTDNTFATEYGDPMIIDGAIVALSYNGIIEYYDVVDKTNIAGIVNSEYSIAGSAISYVANKTPVSAFKAKITTEANNTMKVLDSLDNEVADEAIVTDGMKLKVTSQNGQVNVIYTIDVLNAISENFESWPVKKYDILNWNTSPTIPSPWSIGGFPEAETGRKTVTDDLGNVTEVYPSAYLETITDSERNGKVLDFWSKANTPNDISSGFRHTNILKSFNQYEANDVFMVDVAMKTDNASANTSVTTKYMSIKDKKELFMEIVTLSSNQALLFFSSKIGTYKLGEWHRYTALVDVKNSVADLYIDGVKVVSAASISNDINYFTQIRFQQQFAFGTARNSYFDDIKVEKLYSAGSLDATPFTTQLTSGVYTIKPGYIKGVGANVTAATLKAGLVKANNDITLGVYLADKQTTVADSAIVAEGMTVKVVSADGLSVNYYTLSNSADVGSIVTKIDGTETDVLTNGLLTVQTDTWLYNQSAAIIIARYEGGKLAEMVTNSTTASGILSAQLNISNAANSSIKVMVVDSLGNIKPYTAAKTLNP